ncbi:adenine deaminase [Arboricoccus pini]
MSPSRLAGWIDQATGQAPLDLLITNARLLNTATGAIQEAAIAIGGERIVGLDLGDPGGARFAAARTLDAAGRYAVPGFIDTHLHIESSMVTPDQFERAVLPRGTTTAICDPHEIANVAGAAGISYFLAAARTLRMTLKVNLSSCVPATALETAGARLDVDDLLALKDDPAVLGLAEMMNFPGVLAKEPAVLAKLAAFAGDHIDGHAPLLRGPALDAYLAAGILTDHECTSFAEAWEKLEKGMAILMREGSVAKNVKALAPLIGPDTWQRLAFCTDDRNPLEIAHEGHIDYALRLAIDAGAPLIPAYRAATLGAAMIMKLEDRGLIGPGKRADILLIRRLEDVDVEAVVCGGSLVEPDFFADRDKVAPVGLHSIRRARVEPASFEVAGAGRPTPIIVVHEAQLLTDRLEALLPEAAGCRQSDPKAGIMKLAVLERHGRNGNIGLGFVQGFGTLKGAIATSIGHDSHNITVISGNEQDMALAVNRLIEIEGGSVVVEQANVLAELRLPIAGLMSDRPLEAVSQDLAALRAAALRIGCSLAEPVLQLAFLPLPVIPHLKLTDMGLVATEGDGLKLIEL